MMRTNISLLDIFAPSNISCQVIFEVAGVLPLVRIQCLLPQSTGHQLMARTRSITIPKVFRWLTTSVRRTLRFFFDDGITSWQTRQTHQRGKSYNHRSILTRPAFSFDRISSQLFGADGVFRRWHEKGRWEGFFDGCPTWQVVKKEPLHDDDCSIRAEGFRENRISRGPCQKVEIRSSKNIEINPDNWNAKSLAVSRPQISLWLKKMRTSHFKVLQLVACCVFQVADFRNVHFQYPTIVWQAIFFSVLQSKSLDLQFCAAIQMQIHWTVRQPRRKI